MAARHGVQHGADLQVEHTGSAPDVPYVAPDKYGLRLHWDDELAPASPTSAAAALPASPSTDEPRRSWWRRLLGLGGGQPR